MKTEDIIKLAALRDRAELIDKASYERLSSKDFVELIDYIIDNDRYLRKKLKDIVKDARKSIADKILMQRQTTITFDEDETYRQGDFCS